MAKARDTGFLDWNLPSSTFNADEALHIEQLEHGDMNWIVPNKFLALSCPQPDNYQYQNCLSYTPEDYLSYFRLHNVQAIVQLNRGVYDQERFTRSNIRHYLLYFPDGSCPSPSIVQRFMKIADYEPGALGVHCKAGLGRTGTLICLWLMRTYRWTARECIGYIRVCRPGSVIGPQ